MAGRLRPWQITTRMSDAELRQLDGLVDELVDCCGGEHPAECVVAGVPLTGRGTLDRSAAIRWAVAFAAGALDAAKEDPDGGPE